MMKTVGIDCRFASTRSGLGRFTRELVTHLLRRDDPWRYVLFARNPHEEWLHELRPARCQLQAASFPHYSLSEQLRFPRMIYSARIDLLFSPHFNVPLLSPVPTVVTIHDLILHRYPNEAPLRRRLAYRFLFRSAVRRARRVLCVSQFTADELCAIEGEELRPKITVTLEGVSPRFHPLRPDDCQPVLRRYGIRESFFLYVGNAKQHKNVQMLIDAYASLRDPSTSLVLVTGGKETSRLRLVDGVRLVDAVSDEDLPALYSAARVFVTASLYEGFCLPLAEAAACGCPIIGTRRGAIPEVAPPGALLVDPTLEAMSAALASPPPAAPAPERKWTWEAVAEHAARVLGQCLAGTDAIA
ncbi:MAG: group 1 glycosyl transferase [Candidatus Peregrinibacteria bacterium Greene0416_19]|nr:MAG: group 1 glycosyl transferase [Candidatus Peregrinibacteria bacterium Greene0416_19]